MSCPNKRLSTACGKCVRTHPGRTGTHPIGESRTGRPHRAARTHPQSASGRTCLGRRVCTTPNRHNQEVR
jgi:hypothetical protein